jgi:hypothetical protein
MNYIKQNHLSLLIILWLVVSAIFIGNPQTDIFSAINRPSTTITNPVVFQQGVTISSNDNKSLDALTVVGTTTIAKSYDGFIAYAGFTMATTSGYAEAIYTNSSGVDMMCSTGNVYFDATAAFAPSIAVSAGVSATGVYSVTLLASTTIATTTDTMTSTAAAGFYLANGSSIVGNLSDYNSAIASSTYYGNWTAQMAFPCWLVGK